MIQPSYFYCHLRHAFGWILIGIVGWVGSPSVYAEGPDDLPIKPVHQRFADQTTEVPDFQRHVSPLLSRLGCNGRACHGSFQGQAGFRLSLFGYDFDADHQALASPDHGRIDAEDHSASLILAKPAGVDSHEGGKRFEVGSWQYNLLRRWIQNGAKPASKSKIERLEVVPAKLVLQPEQFAELHVIAHWSDGTSEDVTPLTRFQINNPALASVSETGQVRAEDLAGNTNIIAFYDNAVTAVPVLRPVIAADGIVANPETPDDQPIDRLVKQKLNLLGIRQSELCDDLTFLRRVSLDITGTLPTPEEIRQFLAEERPDKRDRKIEQLLETPAYSAWWATYFCDLTGNNSRQLRGYGANPEIFTFQWYEWLRSRIERNIPYDEMVEGIVLSISRQPNESYTDYCARMSQTVRKPADWIDDLENLPLYWMRREFQNPDERAISFAHAFMGVRIQCAQCHKHPFDRWTKSDFEQFSRFFSGVSVSRLQDRRSAEWDEINGLYDQLEIDPSMIRGGRLQKALQQALKDGHTVPFVELKVHPPRLNGDRNRENRKKKQPDHLSEATLLGDRSVTLSEIEDVRVPVMKWLREPDNPYFANALVNRIWSRYFGIGLVDPVDDLNLANPPSNAALLEYLSRGFVRNGYDLKWMHRQIANSRTYQTGWRTNETNQNDRRNFSRALPRRLAAEVVFDAAKQAASNQNKNARYLTQYAGRAIAIPGTNLNTRVRGKRSPGYALDIFGRSTRSSSCDCDRSNAASLTQSIYLKNDRDIYDLLNWDGGWIAEIEAQQPASDERNHRRNERLQQQIDRLSQQIEIRREKGQHAAADRLQKQRNKAKNGLKQLEPLSQTLPVRRPEDWIEEAYLRTVSRFPDESERKRCLAFLENQTSLAEGMKGILWALINTKEFVVNH